MKYIDADQIRAEIKAQKNDAEGSYVPGDDNNYWYGKVVLCDELLDFLDSIPEQVNGPSLDQVGTKFTVEGLEEEYIRFIGTDHHKYQDLIGNGGIDLARHFAEWGAEHLKR